MKGTAPCTPSHGNKGHSRDAGSSSGGGGDELAGILVTSATRSIGLTPTTQQVAHLRRTLMPASVSATASTLPILPVLPAADVAAVTTPMTPSSQTQTSPSVAVQRPSVTAGGPAPMLATPRIGMRDWLPSAPEESLVLQVRVVYFQGDERCSVFRHYDYVEFTFRSSDRRTHQVSPRCPSGGCHR